MIKKINELNYKVLVWALLISITSLIILLVIDLYWTDDTVLKHQIVLIVGAIETSAIVVGIWDFIAKKSFAKEIIDLANISTNIKNSGIIHIYNDFNDVDWKLILENTKSLQIAVIYAKTWRESNRKRLSSFVSDNRELIVYMPDYNDQNILIELASRFKTSTDKVKSGIQESYNSFKNEIGAKVYLYRGSFQCSYYICDNNGIMSFFNHKLEKSTVPAILMNNQGELYKYITSEINAIAENSYDWVDVNER